MANNTEMSGGRVTDLQSSSSIPINFHLLAQQRKTLAKVVLATQ
jgi:hypothetical protein